MKGLGIAFADDLADSLQLADSFVKSTIVLYQIFLELLTSGRGITLRTKRRGVPNLGERIASFMEDLSLDASELSARTGISVSYLTRIIRGEVVNPTIDFVSRIAAGLGVTVTQLLSDEDTQGVRLVKVEEGEAGEEEGQGGGTPTYSAARAAIGIPDSLFDTTGEKIKEIKHLINSLSLTDDEEEMVASQLDTTLRLVKFIAAQRKMRKGA